MGGVQSSHSAPSSTRGLRPALKPAASAREVAALFEPAPTPAAAADASPSVARSVHFDASREASSLAASPIASTSANVMHSYNIDEADAQQEELEIDALLPQPTEHVEEEEEQDAEETARAKRRKAKGKAKAIIVPEPVSVQALDALDETEDDAAPLTGPLSLPVDIPRLRNALAPTARSPRFNKGMPPPPPPPPQPNSPPHTPGEELTPSTQNAPAEPEETGAAETGSVQVDRPQEAGEQSTCSLYPALPPSFRAARMLEPPSSEVDMTSPLVGSEAPSSPASSHLRTADSMGSPLAPSPGGMRALSLYPKLPASLRSEHDEDAADEQAPSPTQAKGAFTSSVLEPAPVPTSAEAASAIAALDVAPQAAHALLASPEDAQEASRVLSPPETPEERASPPAVRINGAAAGHAFQGFREVAQDQDEDQENVSPALSVPSFLSPALASTSPARIEPAGASDAAPIDFTEDTESDAEEAEVAPSLRDSSEQGHRSVLAPISTPRAPRQSMGHLARANGFHAAPRAASSRRSSVSSLGHAGNGTALQSVAALGASVLGIPGVPHVPRRAPSIRDEPPQSKRRVKRDPMGMKKVCMMYNATRCSHSADALSRIFSTESTLKCIGERRSCRRQLSSGARRSPLAVSILLSNTAKPAFTYLSPLRAQTTTPRD